ncbi:MAG: hypothetical protein IPL47_10870 [Phyllobacteriaceae bacterium]|nr:hypothetical protein [Phyllobacteriaceae bacterium]
MIALFRLVYLAAAVLAAIGVGLIAASLLVAGPGEWSVVALGASAFVSFILLGVGWLALAIRRHLSAATAASGETAVKTSLAALALHLSVAGVLLDLLLSTMDLAFISRMREGFAVFG